MKPPNTPNTPKENQVTLSLACPEPAEGSKGDEQTGYCDLTTKTSFILIGGAFPSRMYKGSGLDQVNRISHDLNCMKKEMFDKIVELKRRYDAEGFIVLGIFGSCARGDETPASDIDILYRLDTAFLSKHSGWKSCDRIERIQKEFADFLGRSVDLADINALDKVGRYFILPEVVYVA